MSNFFPKDRQNICNICRYAKDRFRESCYCTMYGIIISFGKVKCKGYEQVRQSEDPHIGGSIRQRKRIPAMAGIENACESR